MSKVITNLNELKELDKKHEAKVADKILGIFVSIILVLFAFGIIIIGNL